MEDIRLLPPLEEGKLCQKFDVYIGGKFYADYKTMRKFLKEFPEVRQRNVYNNINGKNHVVNKDICVISKHLSREEYIDKYIKYLFYLFTSRNIATVDAEEIYGILKKYL